MAIFKKFFIYFIILSIFCSFSIPAFAKEESTNKISINLMSTLKENSINLKWETTNFAPSNEFNYYYSIFTSNKENPNEPIDLILEGQLSNDIHEYTYTPDVDKINDKNFYYVVLSEYTRDNSVEGQLLEELFGIPTDTTIIPNILAKSNEVCVDSENPGIDLSLPDNNFIIDLSVMDTSQIGITWIPPQDVENIDHYYVYRGTESDNLTELTDFPFDIDTTLYLDNNIEPDTTYYYMVSAFDSENNLIATTKKLSIMNKIDTSKQTIVLYVNSPIMLVNGIEKPVDPNNVPPVTPKINEKTNRVVLPIKTLIENLGGTISYTPDTKQISITLKSKNIILTIDSKNAIIDGKEHKNILDTPPYIDAESSRTLVPLKFVIEKLGYKAIWDGKNLSITIEF